MGTSKRNVPGECKGPEACMSLVLSRRRRKQSFGGAGTYRPEWDLIPVSQRFLQGRYSLICVWNDPSAAVGKSKVQGAPTKAEMEHRNRLSRRDVGGLAQEEKDTRGAAGQRPARTLGPVACWLCVHGQVSQPLGARFPYL